MPEKLQEPAPNSRRAKIRALIQRCEEIPTVPSVVHTITELTSDVNCSLAELEAAIKADQSCVARLLQLANSALYGAGGNRGVTSVRRAILSYGLNAVKNLTLSLTVFDCFNTKNSAEIAVVDTIRLHSLAVASLSKHIAETSPRDIDTDLAFCAGLLHDIGRIVLLHMFPQEYYALLAQFDQAPEADLSKAEFDTFEVTHAVAGQWLGEQWRFPAPLLQVIATHHSTHVANPLVATVMLANALADMQGIGLGGLVRSSGLDALLRMLGLSPQRVDAYARYLEDDMPHLTHIVSGA
ncbi:MAG: HDOD domain-containing protein [Candidatus Tectimicrobiota bacterium]